MTESSPRLLGGKQSRQARLDAADEGAQAQAANLQPRAAIQAMLGRVPCCHRRISGAATHIIQLVDQRNEARCAMRDRLRISWLLILTAALLCCNSALLQAQTSLESRFLRTEAMVPARDGVKL